MKKKKGLKLQEVSPLSSTQKEILTYLQRDYLTPSRIANIRGTSLNAVYKTIDILERKGVFNPHKKKVENFDHTLCDKKTHKIRLHGQHFVINIIKKGKNYDNIKTKANIVKIDENTIKLHNEVIEVYSNKSFFSDNPQKATSKSFDYWNRFFIRLENDLDVMIVKDRYQNIKLVQNHYAETNNELSEEVNREDIKIRVYGIEDSKMWFEIDNSFNLNEAETTHPETAKRDMEAVIQPFFNDIRKGEHLLPSEVKEAILQTQKQVYEIANGLNALLKLQTPSKEIDFPQETKGVKPNYVG